MKRKMKSVLSCICLMAMACGCISGNDGVGNKDLQDEEVGTVVKTISSWLEPYLIDGRIVEEYDEDDDVVYLMGRVGKVDSIFNVIDFSVEISKGKRSVGFFGVLPTTVSSEQMEDMAELISRGEFEQGLSSAWLVLDDSGHIRCQTWASFDGILHNAEETRVNLIGAAMDKLLSFSNAVAAIELGCVPKDAISAIGQVESFQKAFGGHYFGKEDDVKFILKKYYNSEAELSSENIDSWWKSLSSKEGDSKTDFIQAQMEGVSEEIGGRYDVLPYMLIVRDGMVWSVCVMPDICPIEQRRAVAMELMRINFGLSSALLHMDFDTGKIWCCCSLSISDIRDEKLLPPNDCTEACLKFFPVVVIAVNSEKICATFTSDEEETHRRDF